MVSGDECFSSHIKNLCERPPVIHMPADAGAAAAEPLERARRLIGVFIHLPRSAKNTTVGIAEKAAHIGERIAEEYADLVWKFAVHALFQLPQCLFRTSIFISEPRKERPYPNRARNAMTSGEKRYFVSRAL